MAQEHIPGLPGGVRDGQAQHRLPPEVRSDFADPVGPDRPSAKDHGTLRNLVIGLIRQAGYTKIAATIRKVKHDTALLTAILGLGIPS
jgi:hypothetical protein